MRKVSVLAMVLTAGLATAACDVRTSANGEFSFDIASGKATDTWSRTYALEDGGRLELINVNGRIHAEPAEGTEVVVEGRRTAKGSTDEAAKENLAKLEIREEVGETRVRVESRPPRMSGFNAGHEIEWTVKVPKGVIVDLRTVNGGVRLNGLSGEMHAKTTNGGVKGMGLVVDTIEASAVNGGIEIELGAPLDATDSVELQTVNGGVTLGLPGESKATISARAVNGGVRTSNLEIAKEDQGREMGPTRRLNGTLNGGGATVNLNTTNGGVRIERAQTKTS
jgi:hypothetical protein